MKLLNTRNFLSLFLYSSVLTPQQYLLGCTANCSHEVNLDFKHYKPLLFSSQDVLLSQDAVSVPQMTPASVTRVMKDSD